MKITIFNKKYERWTPWGVSKDDNIIGYVKMTFDPCRILFTVSVPNFTACFRNPLTAIQKVLIHEGIGMQKYDALKGRLRSKKLWKTL